MDKNELLDPEFMKRIEQLRLVSRKVFTGRMKGERRSKRKGQSVEFADYRDYSAGDDLRFLDWNIYARLDRLFIKLFMEEEDLSVYIFLDTSESMGYGEPSKMDYAKKVAAALAYIALSQLDRVTIGTFADGLLDVFPPRRGKKFLWRMLDFLADLKEGGKTSMAMSAREFTIRYRRKGIIIILSDFLDKAGYEEPLKYFIARNLDIYAVHILAAQEVSPDLKGDLRLVDCEDGDETEITISAPLLKSYRKNLEAYLAELKEYCTQRGILYAFAPTNTPFDKLILSFFRRRGLVR